MAKKYNLVFDDVDKFLEENPAFAIKKPMPNTGAIRAVLNQGGTLPGVRLVEVTKETGSPLSDGGHARKRV